MASIPSTIKAVVVQPDKTVQFTDFPGPKLNDEDDIIVKNYSCAQNPTDGKGIAMGRTKPGRVTGCDFMGKVAAIGSNVKNIKVGDRVASFSMGAVLEDGTGGWAEYSVVPAGRAIRIPDSISNNEAATIPLAGLTAYLSLYQQLQLPEPPAKPSKTPIVIWGGASSVGMFAIQFAALSGLEVITTASPQNHELLKSLGAAHTLDYRSSTVVQDISRLSGGRLEYILDCISEKGSTEAAVEALPGPGGKVVTLLPVDPTKLSKEVELHVFALFKVAGKGYAFGGRTFPPSPEDKATAEEACGKISKLLFEGKVKGNPVKVVGGLDDVEKGFKLVNEGKVRAEKLVYEVINE